NLVWSPASRFCTSKCSHSRLYSRHSRSLLFKDASTKFNPEEKVDIEEPDATIPDNESRVRGYPRKVPRSVKDGLVLFVSWKVLAGLRRASGDALLAQWRRRHSPRTPRPAAIVSRRFGNTPDSRAAGTASDEKPLGQACITTMSGGTIRVNADITF